MKLIEGQYEVTYHDPSARIIKTSDGRYFMDLFPPHDDTDVMMIEMYPQKPSMVPKEDIIQRTPSEPILLRTRKPI